MDAQSNIGCFNREGVFVPKHRFETVFTQEVRTFPHEGGKGGVPLPPRTSCLPSDCVRMRRRVCTPRAMP